MSEVARAGSARRNQFPWRD